MRVRPGARPRGAAARDIAAGQARLRELLGERVDPFFTPPWNRCTRDTGEVLVELGFTLLSREHRAEPLGLLPELPVHLDVARLTPEELDARFAARVDAGGPVGVMFHHGVMEPDDMARASELLALLAGPRARAAAPDGASWRLAAAGGERRADARDVGDAAGADGGGLEDAFGDQCVDLVFMHRRTPIRARHSVTSPKRQPHEVCRSEAMKKSIEPYMHGESFSTS